MRVVNTKKDRLADTPCFQLSEGEIHFLWWFIQGSIMTPGTRWRLRKAWGFCDRHAWGFIQMDAAFRHGWMHGPAILYLDIMERAWTAINFRSPLQRLQLIKRLGNKGPCPMCEMEYGPESTGKARADIIQKGRDLSELQKFALVTRPYWEKAVCGRCAESESSQRCRTHFIEDLRTGKMDDYPRQQPLIKNVLYHIEIYSRSFRFGYHGIETNEDKAALISAVGWCSGWQTFLSLVSPSDSD
jgi:hypothetical protein